MLAHQESTEVLNELPMEQTCCHHWIIESANGPVSEGFCMKCEEKREFRNSLVEEIQDF